MRSSFLLVAVAMTACTPSGPTWHGDVEPLFAARCASCHAAGGIAPFALTDFASAKQFAAASLDAMEKKRMPPWRAAEADVRYLRDPSLTPAQVATMAAWVKAGTPEGDPKSPKATVEPITGGIARVDLELPMPEAYTPTKSPDDYRCFPVRWPKTETQFVTGFNAVPGTPGAVHHIALYLVPPEAAATVLQWDGEEAGPGYTCYGGPFGDRPQQFAVGLVNAWVPGYQGVAFPRGLGVEVPPGALLVLQLHYNVDARPQSDLTKMQFTLEKTVEKRAAYQPFLNVAWPAGQMKLPSGKVTTHQFTDDPRAFFSLLGSPLETANGFDIEAVMFHMHRLGSVGELWLEKPDRTQVKVLTVPNWDFNWQFEYYLAQPLRFSPGDKLRVRCTFDNTAERTGVMAPPETNWGENSTEEMCVANIFSSQL